MQILLTGGAGFMGSTVARTLTARGHAVRVLDALTYAGRREHLAGTGISLTEGDVCDEALVGAMVEDVETVVHMAAESHVERSLLDPGPFLRTNIDGTRVVLEACRRAGRSLVHVSTDEVFGTAAPGYFFREEDPFRPGNPYAATKAAAECLIDAWRHSFGFRVKVVRCTNNYGLRQHPEKAVMGWIQRAIAGEVLPIHGDGAAVRDWLHVDDFAEGLSRVVSYEGPRDVFHLAGQQPRSNRQMAETIRDVVGRGELVAAPERRGQDARYALDDAATRRDLGWAPVVSLEEGLGRLVAEIRRSLAER